MNQRIAAAAICLITVLFIQLTPARSQDTPEDFTRYVNPMVGTQRMGHTFPGATMPFGMVQLSPDTDTLQYSVDGHYNPDVYQYCAGYQYDDPTIVGFSHTHFSGTGHSDLGDFLVMPTVGKLQLNPGTAGRPESGFRSRFSHDTEKAEPDYYRVKLDDYDILAELTATTRVGVHRYTFPASDSAHIILDLKHGIYNYPGKNVWTFVRVENDTLVTGYRQTNGWARTRYVYFAMAFSKPFKSYGRQKLDPETPYHGFWGRFDQAHNFPEMAGHNLRAYFNFNTEAGEQVEVKFALSPTSTAGALKNLRAETPGWDFDRIRGEGRMAWNRELGKVEAESMNRREQETFYTALYHSFLSPITYMDVDGRYRGLDQNNHRAEGFTNYTVFSLWDTYRALHPLFNLLQPARNVDMIKSMLAHYDQSVHHMLPIWSHYANENWCMIGYHSAAVIADAVVKGNDDFDTQKALEAVVSTSNVDYFDGIGDYKKYGYVPSDGNSSSVSKTLEYAYDDWAIARMARKLGRKDVYERYQQRSQNYRHVYDASIGFMRPRRADGSWRPDFNTRSTHGQGFIEGNAWNYSLYVPQNPDRLISMMGGKQRFAAHLDSLFTMQLSDEDIAQTEDITRDGIIGSYVHGNEPGHHIPYLYNWAGQPWKTQERVRMIMERMYSNTPDGLCGNDDAGQMSAWYVFSALGFYPVAPGSDHYAVGSPLVKRARIHLENGHTLTIETRNQSPENVYVKRILVNGSPIHRNYLTHGELTGGATVTFEMSSSH